MMGKHDEYIRINGRRMTVADFEAMPRESVRSIYARDCTALTEIHAPNAWDIFASGCTALTELHTPNAVYIDARGCTALTEIHAPNAGVIHAQNCTSLAGLVHGGEDIRGYYFFGLPQRGKYRIFAGCRNYTPKQALAHWGPGGPSDRPDCLALVQKIIAEIKKRELV